MNSTTLRTLFFLAATLLVVTAQPALGFDSDDGFAGRSFLQVIVEGARWPGVIIAAMSLASVTIIVENFWTIRRRTLAPAAEIETTRQLIEARKFKECIDYVQASRTMFADVLAAGLRHGRHGFEAMHEAADERAGAWSSRLFRKVEYLNVIGNLGPLMGLLGTVLGMVEAFGQMQASQGAYRPESLAGGISLALVNTFLGLSVAIVSLGFYGICRNRVDALTVWAHAAAVDQLAYFRPLAPAASAAIEQPPRVKPPAAGRTAHQPIGRDQSETLAKE